jgi:hypothetical protein
MLNHYPGAQTKHQPAQQAKASNQTLALVLLSTALPPGQSPSADQLIHIQVLSFPLQGENCQLTQSHDKVTWKKSVQWPEAQNAHVFVFSGIYLPVLVFQPSYMIDL